MPRKRTISEEDLLQAARGVFVERGFAASTREIARRAGVSEALLFQRYATKAELFFAAMVPPTADLDALFNQVHPSAELREGIERLGLAVLDYYRAALPVMEPLMSHPAFQMEEFARRHPSSPMVAMRWQMVRFFTINRVPDPSAAALLLLGAMRSVATYERLGAHGGKFPTELILRALRCLWEGVDPSPSAAP
ncbi:MAG: TetR/AcrR family transcriptional regulator [Bryobacteraceae bacterium]|nr:TetR/AcrR family transcriptional regulator [Bryobacteraceae bacterium]